MSTLQIHITAGPQAGARLQLNQSPVTFGRAGDCSLVLDLPVVSRLHGELYLDEAQGQWMLTNHSPNGTRVGRKKANKKPVPLADGAAIIIGDTEVFRVHIIAPDTDTPPAFQEEPDDTAQPTKAAPGAGAKGKSKLWIGLGAWFAVCLIAMIFFATLKGDDDNKPNSSNSAAFYYPGRGIDDLAGKEAGLTDIRRLLAEKRPQEDPNAARYSSYLDRARQAAEQGPTGLYEAYRNYQLAISVSSDPDRPFEPVDVGQYDRILNELAEIIYTRYVYAYNAYHSNEYQLARQTLDELRLKYYDVKSSDDDLANHIRKLRNAAHSKSN